MSRRLLSLIALPVKRYELQQIAAFLSVHWLPRSSYPEKKTLTRQNQIGNVCNRDLYILKTEGMIMIICSYHLYNACLRFSKDLQDGILITYGVGMSCCFTNAICNRFLFHYILLILSLNINRNNLQIKVQTFF